MAFERQLTPAQVAEVLSCNVYTVRALIRDGVLAALRIPGRGSTHTYRVAESEVQRYIKSNQTKAAS